MSSGPDPSSEPAPPPTPPTYRPADGRAHERGSTTGAWAAAAVVLAVGALIFAVLAHLRISELEDRVGVLEAANAARAASDPTGGLVDPGPGATLPGPAPTDDVAGTQPADVAAAKESVIAAFGAVYSPTATVDERVRGVDDPTGVAAALRQAIAGPSGTAVTAVTVNVNDVRFTSASRATVIYGLTMPGQPPVLGRQGEARVAAGAWKVTRATVCSDLAAVGGDCG